jgi:predicted ABC-type ATPase
MELLPLIIDVCDKMFIYDNSVMPTLIFTKDEAGNKYFPTEIWPIEKLIGLLKR